MLKYSFAPLIEEDSKILILGTMPGEQSILMNQYYGHSRNNFWKILFTLFGKELSKEYIDKIDLLKQNKIAVWDVLESCHRIGSLDSAIKLEVANDLNNFLKKYPNIKSIYFNGQLAAKLFRKHFSMISNYNFYTLPSTSPANASKNFESKIAEWKIILDELKP